MKYIPFLFLLTFSTLVNLIAQDCDITLSGKVIDENTELPLEFATLYLEEAGFGGTSDTTGTFRIENLCPGSYHLRLSHIGCEEERIFITIERDTQIIFELHHHTELLDEVVIHGERGANTAQTNTSIGAAKIDEQANENLAEVLKNISGVSMLKNGSGISKPVIHGLYGNRIAILNNGIAQSGQQWGNDHAPEIDPLTADHISVVKGAGVLAYNGTSLGGLVLTEPGHIADEPHLHGKTNYLFQTNGFGHTLNLQLEKQGKYFAWRTTGTLKLVGDRHTPDYFLTNTGSREGNFSVQLEREFGKRIESELYYSQFNTQLGVLRGSHIGNITDLEQALTRETPFFTRDTFSYAINAPSQKVQHHLLKAKLKYDLNENAFLTFIYGGQVNNRKEFDVRRSGQSDIPALSLLQLSHFIEGNYRYLSEEGFTLKTGLQYNYVGNTNNPETNIFPLIPDYESQAAAGFLVLTQERNKWFFEIGARYSYKFLDALVLSEDLPRRFLEKTHNFHNIGLSGGLKYAFNDKLKTAFNLGSISRNPEVNELYSRGLHQGVSGIEEGDENLNSEYSVKATWLWEGNIGGKFFVQSLAYFQRINDYIYLQPQDEFRLTIRGAFPVFLYKQSDANIYGADFTTYLQATDNLRITAKYAYIKGDNLTDDTPLVFIPSNNFSASIKYDAAHIGKFNNCAFELNSQYVFRQENLLDSQDFAPTPESYFLLGAQLSGHVNLNNTRLKLFLRGENLLNTRYRDYLNRLRYFADDLGRSFVIGGSWKF